MLCNPGIDTIYTSLPSNAIFNYKWFFEGVELANTTSFLPVLQAGEYSLTVSANNCQSVDKNINVINDGIQASADTTGINQEFKLYASNKTTPLQWFNNYNDNNPFFEGDTLTITLQNDDTLYFEEPSTISTQSFSVANNGVNQNSSFYGKKFSLSAPASLKSFKVITIAGGSVDVELLNASNLSSVFTASYTAINGLNTIVVDWDLSAGTYILRCTASPAGQLALLTNYSLVDSTKGAVTMLSGVYNSFSNPAFSDKSNFYGFFNDFVFNSGLKPECERKAIIINASNGKVCEQGVYTLNNVLLTYGQPSFKVITNYIGDNELVFRVEANDIAEFFVNDFVRNKRVGNTTYTVSEVCDGDTLQQQTAALLVDRATLRIMPKNDTIKVNEALPSIALNISGFKFNDNESDVVLPSYTHSTDGKTPGDFSYVRNGELIAQNYKGEYKTGQLTVLSTIGINDVKFINKPFVFYTNNQRFLRLKQGERVRAYTISGKLLWDKQLSIGDYELSNETQLLINKDGELIGR